MTDLVNNPETSENSVPGTKISELPANATMVDVISKINEIIQKSQVKRDRGPESTRTMTEADARRVILGDLKDASHTKAAEATGLSYGQVYSARKGFTFKGVYQEGKKLSRKS